MDTEAERKLKERAAELGIEDRVEFLGAVAGGRKLDVLRRSGVFILPSHIENMPIVIIEAMAAALPVVATRVGAIPEMVDDNVNGILIDVQDPGALGRAVDLLLSDAELRHSFGRHGADKARTKWDLEVGARATRELFEGLICTTARQL
jgi:glycosyltransferase involved in cell wall biosynthesis